MGALIGILAGVGGLFLVFAVLAGFGWVLFLLEGRRRRRTRGKAAEQRARRRARDEAAGAAAERLADLVDEEYRALCERENGR
jgi:hypothetical protein